MISSLLIVLLLAFPQGKPVSSNETALSTIRKAAEQGDWNVASAQVGDWVHRYKKNGKSMEELFQLGIDWVREYRFDCATWLVALFVEHFPDQVWAHANRALTFRRAGMEPQAEKAYQEALALFPKEGALLNDYGLLLQARGDFAAAERILVEAFQFGNWDSAENLCVLKQLQGDRAKSLAYLQMALPRDNPDHPRRWARSLFGFSRLER